MTWRERDRLSPTMCSLPRCPPTVNRVISSKRSPKEKNTERKVSTRPLISQTPRIETKSLCVLVVFWGYTACTLTCALVADLAFTNMLYAYYTIVFFEKKSNFYLSILVTFLYEIVILLSQKFLIFITLCYFYSESIFSLINSLII